MTLTGKQKNYLRGIAHNLHPIIMIGGKGLTEAIFSELELALEQHELLKIKLPGGDKAEKQATVAQITERTDSEFVQLIGRIAVIYRASDESKITLPSA